MLLALDAGNTQTVAGLYDGADLSSTGAPPRCARTRPMSSPSSCAACWSCAAALSPTSPASAWPRGVPALAVEYAAVARDRLGCPAVIVGPGVDTGVGMRVDNPDEVGPDRIANAAAGVRPYGGPCVVVDFGTAINFDAVSAAGEFVGGAIAPGVQVATDALRDRAARLAKVESALPSTRSA